MTAAASGTSAASPLPVIDTHIHLFDTTRPGGVPWPSKNDGDLYRPALPPRLRALAEPFNVKGAIEVECSPIFEDNQWVLDIAARNPYIVGMVGNMEPSSPDFSQQLGRFRRNPLFLGIRYGNLWGRNLATQLDNPAFVDGLRSLAAAGMVLDTANPDVKLLEAVLRASDRIPDLRIVLDHLPRFVAAPDALLKDLAARPAIFAKISGVLRRVEDRVPTEPAFYKDVLDRLCATFGDDRILYGSDWPNSDRWGTYGQGFAIVQEYFAAKSRTVAEKYFWKNSLSAYRWKPRVAGQPR